MSEFKTMEACFAEIERRGCMLNNLQQLEPTRFRANLRVTLTGGVATYHGYSEGKTPLEALNTVLTEHGLLSAKQTRQKKMMDLI